MVDAPAVPGRQQDRTVTAAPGRRGGRIRLAGLTKSFDGVTAVAGIDLDIEGGEFFSLLGPSGCGKTTTLRMVAGFERPDAGAVLLDGQDVSAVPPHRRPVNTVFQNYALFPFLSVRDNVAFGLRYADLDKTEARRRCDEALALVRMDSLARRRPHQLSGGQQQRVALARALVLSPRVLLLDEPLGALDAKLRRTLQLELKALQQEVGITFVYVTHDQDEALTMSDRLAVMAGGRVEQVGTPADVYERPATAYVADFLGTANLVPVEVLGPQGHDRTAFRLDSETLLAGPPDHTAGPAILVVRPENVVVVPVPTPDDAAGTATPTVNTLPATVERLVYRGAVVEVALRTAAGTPLTATSPAGQTSGLVAGQPVQVTLPAESARLLPPGALGSTPSAAPSPA